MQKKHKLATTLATAIILSLSIKAIAQDPVIWLRADNKGNQSNIWQDVSGNENHACSFRPITGFLHLNHNPVLDFSSISDTVSVNYDISNKGYIKIFTVFSGVTDTAGEQYIWGFGDIGRQTLELGNTKLYNYPKTYKYVGGNISKPIISIVDRYNSNNEASNPERFFIGNGFEDSVISGGFTGRIAEIIVFDEEQETIRHRGFESYLAIKYGICLYKDYYGSDGEMIWSKDDNRDCPENIFAVGRNDDFGLYQKQSTSSQSAVLSFGVEAIERDNASNRAKIPKSSYMFFSDNGMDGNEGISTELNENGSYLISNKIWKANAVGSTMHRTQFTVKVLANGVFDTVTGGFCLIKDSNRDGRFDDLETIWPDSISGEGYAYFSDVKFCSSKSSQDYFTFAQSYPLQVETSYTPPKCESSYGGATVQVSGGIAPYSFSITDESGSVLKQWQSSSNEEFIDSLYTGEYTVNVTDASYNRYAFKTGEGLEATAPDLGISTIYSYTGTALNINLCPLFDEATYIWSQGENVISNECKVELGEEGGYSVKVETGGCAITDQFYVIDISSGDGSTTSTAEPENGNGIAITPNPSASSFDIEIQLASFNDIAIYITDMSGTLIESTKLGNIRQYTYHGTIKTQGVYLVAVVSGNKLIANKHLVIQ